MLTIGSLFSGIGGIELGFELEGGFKVRWFIEQDKYCQRVLRKHWPGVPIYGDIRTVDFERLEPVDILTGGFPCQDISTANPRGKGIEGERSRLWSYFAEAIRVLRPRYAIAENVPMLANKGLYVVLRDLAESGYNAEWNIVSARGVGARHLRRRIFIVAYPECESGYVRAYAECGERWHEQAQLNTPKGGLVADPASRGAQPAQQRGQLCGAIEEGADMADSDEFHGNDGRRAASEVLREQSRQAELSGSEDVADPNAARLQRHGRPLNRAGELFTAEARIQLAELRERNARGIWRVDPADLCNSAGERLPDGRTGAVGEPRTNAESERSDWRATQSCVGGMVDGLPAGLDRPYREHIPRVARGVPDRVARLKCLGNVVVPQVAQFIARRIMDKES